MLFEVASPSLLMYIYIYICIYIYMTNLSMDQLPWTFREELILNLSRNFQTLWTIFTA
jgi:hypothetical protein